MKPFSLLLVFVFVFLPLSALSLGCGGSGRADGDTETEGDSDIEPTNATHTCPITMDLNESALAVFHFHGQYPERAEGWAYETHESDLTILADGTYRFTSIRDCENGVVIAPQIVDGRLTPEQAALLSSSVSEGIPDVPCQFGSMAEDFYITCYFYFNDNGTRYFSENPGCNDLGNECAACYNGTFCSLVMLWKSIINPLIEGTDCFGRELIGRSDCDQYRWFR